MTSAPINAAFAGRPLPFLDADNRPFLDGCARGELWLQKCLDTGEFQFYPRPCSIRTGGGVEWVRVAGRGIIYSFTIIRSNHAAPAFQLAVPYVVALIELEERVRMMGNVVTSFLEDVAIGAGVVARFDCVDQSSQLFLPFWHLSDN